MTKKTIILFVLAAVFITNTTYGKDAEIINENFDDGYGEWDSSMRVGGIFSLVPNGTGKALKVERRQIEGDNSTQLRYRLPPEGVAGKDLVVEVMVKAENIVIGDKPTSGGHIDFKIRIPRGFHYESSPYFTGSFDWTSKKFKCHIAPDAKTIDFRLGLKGAKGAIYFDDVKVFIQE
jgi:hypothetical protein